MWIIKWASVKAIPTDWMWPKFRLRKTVFVPHYRIGAGSASAGLFIEQNKEFKKRFLQCYRLYCSTEALSTQNLVVLKVFAKCLYLQYLARVG